MFTSNKSNSIPFLEAHNKKLLDNHQHKEYLHLTFTASQQPINFESKKSSKISKLGRLTLSLCNLLTLFD